MWLHGNQARCDAHNGSLCDNSRGKKQEQRRIKTGVSSYPGVGGEGGPKRPFGRAAAAPDIIENEE